MRKKFLAMFLAAMVLFSAVEPRIISDASETEEDGAGDTGSGGEKEEADSGASKDPSEDRKDTASSDAGSGEGSDTDDEKDNHIEDAGSDSEAGSDRDPKRSGGESDAEDGETEDSETESKEETESGHETETEDGTLTESETESSNEMKDGDSSETEETSETEEDLLETGETSETEETLETEETMGTEEPFYVTVTMGAVEISMTADEGVFPAGSTLIAQEITSEELLLVKAAIEGKLGDTKQVLDAKAYDLTVYHDGNKVQPDMDKGSVQVTFANVDTDLDSDEEIKVYYVADDGADADEIGASVGSGKISFDPQHFSTYAAAWIGSRASDEEYNLVESVSIAINGQEVTEDTEISLSDIFDITYTLKSPLYLNFEEEDAEDGNIYLSAGNTYELPSLNAETFNLSGIAPITLYLDNGAIEFGTVSFDAVTGAVTLTVNSSETKVVMGLVVGIKMGLRSAAIGDSMEYMLPIPTADGGTRRIAIKISDNQPVGPTVQKSASTLDTSTETLPWTVTIKNDKNPIIYENGYLFKDKLGKGLSYVSGSFKVNGNEETPAYDKDTRVLSYTFTENTANAETRITYETRVDFLSAGSTQNGTITVNAENEASIYDADEESEAIDTDTVSKPVSSKTLGKWLEKSGGSLDADGKAAWEITVNTNGYTMKNLTMYDVFATDASTTMGLVEDSVTIRDSVSGTLLQKGVDYEIVNVSGSSAKSGKRYNWYLRFLNPDDSENRVSGNHIYTISYSTQIEDYSTFLKTNHTTIPSNQAFLEYQYDTTGNGDWTWLAGPTLDRITIYSTTDEIVTKAGIEKSFVSANAATHELTWKVTANKSFQELTGSAITEKVGSGQEFISFGKARITASDRVTTREYEIKEQSQASAGDISYAMNADGNPVIDFGELLKGAKAEFTVVTRLTEDQYNVWAANNSKRYSNTVQLDSDQQRNVSDTASGLYSSKVLEKSAGTYHYDTHTIDYTITVNRNKMAMTDVVVTDDIGSAGLSLVEGTVQLDQTELPAAVSATSPQPNYTYQEGVLTFRLADIAEAEVGDESAIQAITFTAKVDDGDIFTSENGAEVSITNTAKLVTGETGEAGVTVPETTRWMNRVIDKTAEVNQTTKSVTYTVIFNGNRQVLPENLIIKDTLGVNLDLDVTSVKLTFGSIDDTSGDITSTGEEETGYTTSITADGDHTVLNVMLSPRSDNTNIYVLTYTAMPTEIKSGYDYSNNIQLVGYETADVNTATATLSSNSFGGGFSTDPFYLIVTKVDAENAGVKLPGAAFEVYEEGSDVLVATLVTKTNGSVTSVGKLQKNTTYKLIEVTAPKNYEISSREVTFTTGDTGGINNATRITFSDVKKTQAIAIVKKTGSGEDLSDATLSLTKGDAATPFKSWITDGSEEILLAELDTDYTLKETAAPFGYDVAEDIVFKVDSSDGKLKIRQPDNSYSASSDYRIVMTDYKKDTYAFSVDVLSDKEVTKERSLTDAVVSISEITGEGTVEITNWVTNGSNVSYRLPKGRYVIRQSAMPNGYMAKTPVLMNIQIDEDGNFYLWNESSGEYERVDGAEDTGIVEFRFIDSYRTDSEDAYVEIHLDETDPETGDLVEGINMILIEYTEDGSRSDIVEEWTTDGLGRALRLKYQVEYTVSGIGESGVFESITFMVGNDGSIRVIDTDGSSSDLGAARLPVFLRRRAVVPDPEEDRTSTAPTAPVEQPNHRPDQTVQEGSLEEGEGERKSDHSDMEMAESKTSERRSGSRRSGSQAVIEAANQPVENAIETYEEEQVQQSGAEASDQMGMDRLNPHGENLKADEDLPSRFPFDLSATGNGYRLAKTGGFIGTILAYLLGGVSILAGLFLLFKKEKTVQK